MPAPIRSNLTSEEDKQLQEISLAEGIPRRSKLRAMAVRLNADGWTVPKIARHLHQNEHTIRSTIRRWQAQGREGLWEAPRPGRQPRASAADLQAVETRASSTAPLYQSAVMPEVSKRTRSLVKPAPDEPLAPKKGYCWKRLRYSPPPPKDPDYVRFKRADWQMLKQWAESGLIRLLYLAVFSGESSPD